MTDAEVVAKVRAAAEDVESGADADYCKCNSCISARAALAMVELVGPLMAWADATGLVEDENGDELEMGCQSHPARPVAYCPDCTLLTASASAMSALRRAVCEVGS